MKVTLSPVPPSQDEKDFLGAAGLTTLPQVVTTPSFVGVVSSFAKLLFLDCFWNDSRPNGGCMRLGSALGGEADYRRLTPPGCPIPID